MSYSLRPVGHNLSYPRHKWFGRRYSYGNRPHSKRANKKMDKYEWFNEDLFDILHVYWYSENSSFKGVDPRWRLVFRIRRKYLNKRELYDIYKEPKEEYIKKHGKEKYI